MKSWFVSVWVAAVGIFLTAASFASDNTVAFIASKHFYEGKGYPLNSATGNQWVFHDLFVVCNNPTTKFADWVSYRLDASLQSDKDRLRYWRADPLLDDAHTLEPRPHDDYKGAYWEFRFDRGHLCPLASIDASPLYFQANYLSNIVPQKGSLNRGPWKGAESAVRDIASETTVWVMSGTIYDRELPPLPGADEPHKVPSGFWKLATWRDGKELKTRAWIMDQESRGPHTDFVVPIDSVEEMTGLDFFWWVPSPAQELLEARK